MSWSSHVVVGAVLASPATTVSNGPSGELPARISALKPGVSVVSVSVLRCAGDLQDEADAGLRESAVALGRPVGGGIAVGRVGDTLAVLLVVAVRVVRGESLAAGPERRLLHRRASRRRGSTSRIPPTATASSNNPSRSSQSGARRSLDARRVCFGCRAGTAAGLRMIIVPSPPSLASSSALTASSSATTSSIEAGRSAGSWRDSARSGRRAGSARRDGCPARSAPAR